MLRTHFSWSIFFIFSQHEWQASQSVFCTVFNSHVVTQLQICYKANLFFSHKPMLITWSSIQSYLILVQIQWSKVINSRQGNLGYSGPSLTVSRTVPLPMALWSSYWMSQLTQRVALVKWVRISKSRPYFFTVIFLYNCVWTC